MAEHWFCKPAVVGSNPTATSNKGETMKDGWQNTTTIIELDGKRYYLRNGSGYALEDNDPMKQVECSIVTVACDRVSDNE